MSPYFRPTKHWYELRLIVLATSKKVKVLEEISEELLFVFWSVWQYLRILMFIKNQNKAQV
jgi:hypothetical protein